MFPNHLILAEKDRRQRFAIRALRRKLTGEPDHRADGPAVVGDPRVSNNPIPKRRTKGMQRADHEYRRAVDEFDAMTPEVATPDDIDAIAKLQGIPHYTDHHGDLDAFIAAGRNLDTEAELDKVTRWAQSQVLGSPAVAKVFPFPADDERGA